MSNSLANCHCFDIAKLCQMFCQPALLLCQKYVKSTRNLPYCFDTAKLCQIVCQPWSSCVKTMSNPLTIFHCFDIANLCQIFCQPWSSCVKSMSNPLAICHSFDVSKLCQNVFCLPELILCQKYVKSTCHLPLLWYIKPMSNVFANELFSYVKSMSNPLAICHWFDIAKLCQIVCQPWSSCVKSM